MASLLIFLKFILKAILAYSLIVKVWTATFGGVYFSLLMYIFESGRIKSKIIEWFENKRK